ncbi:MAG: hypothetical protein JKY03_04800 [Aureispira sp.]|nr:hypothetical protein [Aureispira sp.]
MNQIAYFGIFFFLTCTVLDSTAQEWKTTEFNKGDTLVSTAIYVDESGKSIMDSLGTHRIVSEYKNYYLLKMQRFGLNNEPTEDERGVHKQVIFLKKFFKFYDKKDKTLRVVKEPYYYEQSNANYYVLKYNEHSDLLEVRFYEDAVIESGVVGIYIRKQINAVESYNGMIHKYQFKYSRNRRKIKEYQYNIRGDYVELRILIRVRVKKKKAKKG